MKKVDKFAQEVYGKNFSDLADEERKALKRSPLWTSRIYGGGTERMKNLLCGADTPEEEQ